MLSSARARPPNGEARAKEVHLIRVPADTTTREGEAHARDGYTAWVSISRHEEHWRSLCEGVPSNDRDFIEYCPARLQVQRERS